VRFQNRYDSTRDDRLLSVPNLQGNVRKGNEPKADYDIDNATTGLPGIPGPRRE